MIQDSRFKIQERGFTLIEIVISLAIFSVVSLVALGALVSIISANKKAQTLQASVSNLNFALESMSREMRVGATYHCEASDLTPISAPLSAQSCTFGSNKIIAFESSRKIGTGPGSCLAVVSYRFSGTLQKAEQVNCNDTLTGTSYTPIISSESVTISDFRLSVSPDPYPLVFIKISGFTGVREAERSYFDVQTAVSPRVP